MTNKIKLYLDFDGVILDTMNVTKKMMEDLNIPDDQEIIKEFYKNIDWYKLLRSTPEINDSFNNINLLLNSGLYDIEILTHVNSKEEGIDGRFITINNLKKLLELHEILNAKINLKRKLLLRTYR